MIFCVFLYFWVEELKIYSHLWHKTYTEKKTHKHTYSIYKYTHHKQISMIYVIRLLEISNEQIYFLLWSGVILKVRFRGGLARSLGLFYWYPK
jgi:hypothetical protein